MDLEHALLSDRSKAQISRIVDYVGQDQERFDHLWSLFFVENDVLVQRAGWAISYCIESNPVFISSHYDQILKILQNPPGEAALRNVLRGLQFVSVPELYQGNVYDLCFRHLMSRDSPVAVRVFSLQVLFNICRDIPELRDDLEGVLLDCEQFDFPAMKARIKNLRKELEKIRAIKR